MNAVRDAKVFRVISDGLRIGFETYGLVNISEASTHQTSAVLTLYPWLVFLALVFRYFYSRPCGRLSRHFSAFEMGYKLISLFIHSLSLFFICFF